MGTRKIVLGLAAAAVLAAPLAMAGSANAASAPTNLSFEEPAALTLTDGYYLVGPTDASLTGWTVAGDGVDVVDTTLWDAKAGNHSIDLNAYGPGSISQDIVTVPNQTYNVTFSMAGNPGAAQGVKTMNVSADATTKDFTFDTTGRTERDMGWTLETFSFVAQDTSTTLTFQSTTTAMDPNYFGGQRAAWGPAIDDVTFAAAPNVAKNLVWHTWTGGSVATAPDKADPKWHATSGDPQSPVHRFANHEEGVPYFVPGNGKSAGAWFLWLAA